MAKMFSNLDDSAKAQYTCEFSRKLIGTGYSNMDGTGPSMSLTFRAADEQETGRFGRKARMTGRNARLTLDASDLKQVLNHLVNPSYTMGYVLDGKSDDPVNSLHNNVMEACGLFAYDYRYPASHYTARDGYVHVQALNERHALHQLAKLKFLGEPDPMKLQRRADDDSGWLEE